MKEDTGNPKYAAILSFLYVRTPGEVRDVFTRFDIMNLPTPVFNIGKDVLKKHLHVLNFLFDSDNEAESIVNFSYYTYFGSQT